MDTSSRHAVSPPISVMKFRNAGRRLVSIQADVSHLCWKCTVCTDVDAM
ncbi:hypothetical protein F444_13496, partial [Phytophthora nicotianae P1976]